MSGLLNSSLNGSTSGLPDSSIRSFSPSFSAQSGAGSAAFHHTGNMQGLPNIHGNFNVPNMPGALGARSSTMNNIPSSGIQQAAGNLSSGRFASNNLPVALSQMSHGSSHVMVNRGGMNVIGNQGFSSGANGLGGSIPGILQSSASMGNRTNVPGLALSPGLGNAGPRITSSVGNIVGGGNIGRNISSGGGLPASGISSRLNLTANSSTGNINAQGPNRMSGGMLQQGNLQVLSMLSGSYPTAGGPLSQNHQSLSSYNNMGMLNDVNSNEGAPFDMIDFPQLTSRPSSSGGQQGHLALLRKQGVNPIVQQNQEFSMQNEDFPALGSKGSSNDYSVDLHQKEQLDSSVSMMQPQHFSMGRPAGFNLGSAYSSHRPQQQQQHAPSANSSGGPFSNLNNQDFLHLHAQDIMASSNSSFLSQNTGPPGMGMRTLNSSGSLSSMGGSYDQVMQQYPQHQTASQFRLPQMSPVSQPYRDQMKPLPAVQGSSDPFGLRGLLNIMRTNDHDLATLAHGVDLTTLGLNLSSSESLHKTFASPWSDEPAKGDPEFTVPACYYAKQPQPLSPAFFSKFQLETLFYIFYGMPKDEAQLFAANELYSRGWFYHKELRLWFMRAPNMEPLLKTNTYERGTYVCFDPNSWETIRKDNFVLHYEMVDKPPSLPQH